VAASQQQNKKNECGFSVAHEAVSREGHAPVLNPTSNTASLSQRRGVADASVCFGLEHFGYIP